jgi:hypothetical protein
MNPFPCLSQLSVRPLAGNRARGWLTAGPFQVPCALGPVGIVRIKHEGDKGTPAGRFRLLWGSYRPDRLRLRAAEAPHRPLRHNQGWCEDPTSPRYNRPVRLPARDFTDRMWREDHLYDLTFVLDQNFSGRAKGRGSAIFGSGANSRRRKASSVVLSRLQAWSTAFHTAGASRPWTPRRPSVFSGVAIGRLSTPPRRSLSPMKRRRAGGVVVAWPKDQPVFTPPLPLLLGARFWRWWRD